MKSYEVKKDLFEYDEAIRNSYPVFCGVDEAGRGPLAGDVYAAAVILMPDAKIAGLDDSKKLTARRREALYDEIIKNSVAYYIDKASVEEIEEINILQATLLAMRRAVSGLKIELDCALVDGNANPHIENADVHTIVKGDTISASIAAASILAKVQRDRYMRKLAEEYPSYFFDRHKGYGTRLHYEKLAEFGETPIHRHSFLKKWYKKNEK